MGIGLHGVNPGERSFETVNGHTSGPKVRIAAAQESNLRSAQAVAIGHAKEHAVSFGRDDIKQALNFFLREYLDNSIFAPWFLQG